ncbi:MAG: zinc-ribbon domain-containing protein [Betaproteobacteria bacterium]
MRRCQDCGAPVGAKDKFCARCGAKLPREPRINLIASLS